MISTHITLAYMLDPNFEDWAVWRACHAVLNATNNTGLTTKEIAEQIRLNFPLHHWTMNTLSNGLSRSDDFKQDRRRGRWFLTGTTRGVPKSGAKRVRKAAEAAQAPVLDVGDGNLGNDVEAEPILNLPYPINVTSAHDHHPPPPPLPPSTSQTRPHTGSGGASNLIPSSTRRQTRSQTRKRAAGYHPYDQPLAANAGTTVDLDHNSGVKHDSQSNSASRPEIKNPTSPPLPIFAEPKPMVGGFPGLLASVPENPPQHIPALYDAFPTRPSAPPPTDASFVPRTQRYPYSEGINPSALHFAYPGNLEAGAVDSQDVAGPSRVNRRHPLQDNPNNARATWMPNHRHEDFHTLPYGNTSTPTTLPAADHTMAFPGYSAVPTRTAPQDFWAYDAPVSQNPDAGFVPTTQRSPYPEGINPAALDFAYPGNLEVGAADSQDVAGPSRVNRRHPLQDNPYNAGALWMPSHGHDDLNTLPYGNTITPATRPAADHAMAFPGYGAVTTRTGPQDFWAYDTPVSHNPVHHAPPTTLAPPQPYPDPEIAPAGFHLDINFS